MDIKKLKTEFLPKYKTLGENKFYELLLSLAMKKVNILNAHDKKRQYPDQELLVCYEQFLHIYRRENDIIFLEIAKIFRRAAHTIYRVMLSKKLTARNAKFLNLV